MARNTRASKAFEAMKALGIQPQTVKPVLKNLLSLFENNWDFIEEDNYRVLIDTIFEAEDSKEEESRKRKSENMNIAEGKKKEALIDDEPEPLKTRFQSRQENSQHCPAVPNSNRRFGESSSKRPKLSEEASSHACPRPEQAELTPSQINIGEKRNDPVSPHVLLREKRTEADSPQIAARGKRPVYERNSNTIRLTEPKVEPGSDILPEGDIPGPGHCSPLIKPKSEPFTGEYPQFEVPIAVIHPPDLVPTRTEEGPRAENGSNGNKDTLETPVSEHADRGEREEDGIQDSIYKGGTGLEIVSVPEAASSNFEIASSTSGEVKLSLTCNSAFDRSDFHMPSLDTVLKQVEDKCLKSYKILEPKFSVMKLMKDICQCVWELGNNSTDDKQQRHVNIPTDLDFLKKSDIENVLGARGNCLPGKFHMTASPSNGSSETPKSSNVIPRLLVLDGLHDSLQPNMTVSGNSDNEGKKKHKEHEDSNHDRLNSGSLVAVQQSGFSIDNVKPLHDVNDICKGEERVKISVVNELSSAQYPPSFNYIPQNLVYQNAYLHFSLARIGDEDYCSDCFGDCLSSALPCACARETGGEYAYTLDGLVKEEFLDQCISMNSDPQNKHLFYCQDCPLERARDDVCPGPCKGHLVRKFIKECWSKCGCGKQCGNRVVQRGITCNLQVFLTPEGKGWGLRTLEELPKGTFACEYVGEVLTNTELYERNMQSTGNERHTYPVLLDADWGSEGILKDEEALCLDATFYGNVARFINHRCNDANLMEIPVEVETPDHHYYHLAFFTTRRIAAMEELTWDYGINFDDHKHPVKAFRCRCGSKLCRDMKRPSRTKVRALVL